MSSTLGMIFPSVWLMIFLILALRHISISKGRADMTQPLVRVNSLLLAILVFFVALLAIFLGLFGLLLSLVLLTFVSHSFLLDFPRVLNLGQLIFFNGL